MLLPLQGEMGGLSMDDDSIASEKLLDIISSQSESLVADFEQIRSEFSHSGLKGDESEDIVRKFLERYLPQTYGFANGQIMDRNGTLSREIDIAICNRFHPYSYSGGGKGLLFIEGVDAVVECKSRLNESHLEAALKNCRSVRELEVQIPEGTQITGRVHNGMSRIDLTSHAIFAFECPYTLETLDRKLGEIIESNGISKQEAPDLIYAHDTGLIVMNREMDGLKLFDESGEAIPGYAINRVEPHLLMFLMSLQDKMPDLAWMPNFFKEYISTASQADIATDE